MIHFVGKDWWRAPLTFWAGMFGVAGGVVFLVARGFPSGVSHLTTCVWLITLLLAVWWSGQRALRWIAREMHAADFGDLEGPLAVALGFGVVSAAVFLVGVGGGLYRRPFQLTAIVMGLSGLREFWRSLRDGTIVQPSLPGGMPGALTVGALALLTYAAFGPQTGDDPLVYHLWCPQEYLRQHRIIPPGDNIQCFGVGAMGMLYLLGLLLDGEHLASLLAVVVGAASLLLIYRAARQVAGAQSAGWATALLVMTPAFLEGVNHAKAEAGTLLMCVGMAVCALRVAEDEVHAGMWYRVGCVFAGLALTFKYQAAYAVAPIFAWLWWMRRRAGWRGLLRDAGAAAGIAAVCLVPWGVQSFVATGDPLFPLLSRWLARTPELRLAAEEWRMHSLSVGPGLKAGWIENLILPVTLTFRDERMGGEQFGWLGLGLWVLLAAGARRHRAASLGLVTGVAAFGLWYLTARRARYLLPSFAVGLLGLAPVLEEFRQAGPRMMLGALYGLAILGNVAVLLRGDLLRMPPPEVVAGRETGRAWAGRRDPIFRAVQRLEALTPPAVRTVVLGDERVKYLTERNVIVHSPFQRSVFWEDLSAAASSGDLAVRLKRRGVTHVMMDESRVDVMFRVNRALQISSPQRAVFDEFWRGCVEVAREGTWVIVRIAR